VWGVIAGLEAASGNVRGAMAALERGLQGHPENSGWWADYAELNMDQDDRPGALRAAAKALGDPNTEARAIAGLVEAGERFYASGQYAEALGACSLAQDRQETNADLAWLRARISAVNQDTDYMVKWLVTTTQLDPGNQGAQDMLAPYKKKKGWFQW
jgi:tetratricopeptide (TPR) repeat protein